MTGVPNKREIRELIARLEREPDEADVWVEGPFDLSVMRHVLRLADISSVSAFPIDDIDIPSSLAPAPDTPGARERVLAVAAEVERELGTDLANVVFTIDRDFDALDPYPTDYGPYVIPTDGTCVESLLWDEALLEAVATLVLRIEGFDAAAALSVLVPIVEELFIMRAAQHSLGLGCRLDSARRCVVVTTSFEATLDRDVFRSRLLQSGAAWDRRGDFDDRCDSIRAALPMRNSPLMNGHDFVDLLGHLLRPQTPSSRRTLLSAESLRGLLVLSAPWEEIVRESRQLRTLIDKLERFRRSA